MALKVRQFQLEFEPDTDGFDSDDDFNLDIAKQTILDGQKAFEENKFEDAELILSDAVQQLQQIPQHRRSACSLPGGQYQLVRCSYHLKTPAEAAKRLLAFVQGPPENNEERSNVCKAVHLLAQVYVRLNRVELARSTCEALFEVGGACLGNKTKCTTNPWP